MWWSNQNAYLIRLNLGTFLDLQPVSKAPPDFFPRLWFTVNYLKIFEGTLFNNGETSFRADHGSLGIYLLLLVQATVDSSLRKESGSLSLSGYGSKPGRREWVPVSLSGCGSKPCRRGCRITRSLKLLVQASERSAGLSCCWFKLQRGECGFEWLKPLLYMFGLGGPYLRMSHSECFEKVEVI